MILNQVAASAASARFHRIGPRLAGWILMAGDRAPAESFHLTQETLAGMLGVRRVGITVAAHELHRLRLIDYRRGDVTLLDVPGLRALAGDCYPAEPGARDAASRSVRSRRAPPRRPVVTQSS